MSYNIEVASFLSGASRFQLQSWAQKGILIPEDNPERPKLYSFRDIVALRAIAKLRAHSSLQQIRQAIANMKDFEFNNHLSEYRFAYDGESIHLLDKTNDRFIDVDKRPGQWDLLNLESIYAPFANMQGRTVPDLRNPSQGIQIDPLRLRGTPTIEGTRVPYDFVVDLAEDDMTAEEIAEFYPTIEANSVEHALRFNNAIKELAA